MEQIGIILGFIILAVMAGIWVYNYIKLDKITKIANLKEWLKYADLTGFGDEIRNKYIRR